MAGTITQWSQLYVKPNLRAASFGVRVRLPTAIIGSLHETGPEDVLDLVAGLLNGSDEATGLAAAPLESDRVRSHQRRLLKLMADADATLTIRTRGNPAGTRVSGDQARERVGRLSDKQDRKIDVRGTLDGGTLNSKRFTIITEDGQEIAGRVVDADPPKLHGFTLGDRVGRLVRRTTQQQNRG